MRAECALGWSFVVSAYLTDSEEEDVAYLPRHPNSSSHTLLSLPHRAHPCASLYTTLSRPNRPRSSGDVPSCGRLDHPCSGANAVSGLWFSIIFAYFSQVLDVFYVEICEKCVRHCRCCIGIMVMVIGAVPSLVAPTLAHILSLCHLVLYSIRYTNRYKSLSLLGITPNTSCLHLQ